MLAEGDAAEGEPRRGRARGGRRGRGVHLAEGGRPGSCSRVRVPPRHHRFKGFSATTPSSLTARLQRLQVLADAAISER